MALLQLSQKTWRCPDIPWDIFDVSVASGVTTDLALGRVWRSGVAVLRVGVYIADAATGFTVNFYMGPTIILGPNGRKNGVQWAGGNDNNTLAQVAQRNLPGETNVFNVLHTAGSNQTATVVMEYEV